MSSPAGHWPLQGGSRSTYTGRSGRHDPVLLASDEPGSSVIANGFCMVMKAPARPRRPASADGSTNVAVSCRDLFLEQAEATDVAVGIGLDLPQHLGMAVRTEQVGEALLRP